MEICTEKARSAITGALILSCTLFAIDGFCSEVQVRSYDEGPVVAADGKARVRDIRFEPAPPADGVQWFGFSVIPALETPSVSHDVYLMRLNLFVGKHRDVYGLDIGILGSMTESEMDGLSIAGIFNSCGSANGAFHFAGIFNYCSWQYSGLEVSAGMNWSEGEMSGLQVALINRVGRLHGIQVGLFNDTETGAGAQIGIVNHAERLTGLQLGLLNVNLCSSVPCLPLVNLAF